LAYSKPSQRKANEPARKRPAPTSINGGGWRIGAVALAAPPHWRIVKIGTLEKGEKIKEICERGRLPSPDEGIA